MKFSVLWKEDAEQELAAIWTESEDRAAVTWAADRFDALLKSGSHAQGESRFDTVRIMLVPPLGIDFEVIEEDRIVYVLSVWTTDRG